jgi:glycine/D-amino acid oxidase-like deaminating enzyme
MPRAVVLGGGVVGLGAAMLRAERGCDVTVVERDPTQVPESPDRPRPDLMHPAGRPAAPPAAGPTARVMRDFIVAILYDADLFRTFLERVGMHALPQEGLARPGMTDRIAAVAAEHEEVVIPGPTWADVLASLS